jgi:serine O-acetyltransferase
MKLSLSEHNLRQYVTKQVNHLFPDGQDFKIASSTFSKSLYRLEKCLEKIKYYDKKGFELEFSHLHSDQFLTFLWILSSQIWREFGHCSCATKIFYLNKILHGFDCHYDNQLPDIFFIAHGVGTVLGKAKYSDYLYVSKGVTVGTSRGGDYPDFDEGVSLGADSTVIGACKLSEFSSVGAGVTFFNKDLHSYEAVVRDNTGALKTTKQSVPLSKHIFKI